VENFVLFCMIWLRCCKKNYSIIFIIEKTTAPML